jgi:hypothetical protein
MAKGAPVDRLRADEAPAAKEAAPPEAIRANGRTPGYSKRWHRSHVVMDPDTLLGSAEPSGFRLLSCEKKRGGQDGTSHERAISGDNGLHRHFPRREKYLEQVLTVGESPDEVAMTV